MSNMGAWPVWAEVDLDLIAHNVREARRLAGPARLMAVVKAGAYGHGAAPVARVALANGAGYLAVARVSEGEELRLSGISASILVLGYIPPAQVEKTVALGLTPAVFSEEDALLFSRTARHLDRELAVHVKVDSGMGRLGFRADRGAREAVLHIASLPGLRVEGMFTHFAKADSRDKSHAGEQLQLFQDLAEELKKAGLDIELCHAANSAALIDLPQSRLDMVRAGIMLYGYHPSREMINRIRLRPAMTLKALVAQVKEVPAGSSIGYGCTYISTAPLVVATLPIGYADGYSRLLSSRGEVLIHGRRCPVLGRVCMDMIMVDVSHIPGVEAGDEAVVLGRQGEEEIWADELAEKIGTISYEVLCSISKRVPRIYTGQNL